MIIPLLLIITLDNFINIEGDNVKYGEGIKTLILWNNRLNELKDIKIDDMEAEDNDQLEDLKLEIEKREALLGGIISGQVSEKEDDRSYKTKTKYFFNLLIVVVFVLVLVFIVLSNIDYNTKYVQTENIFKLYDAVDYSHRRTSDIQNILSNIREIYLINYGLFGDRKSSEVQTKLNNSRTRILKSLQSIKEVQKILVSKTMFSLVPNNQILNTQDVTNIYYKDNISIRSDLDKGVQQFYSVSFDLINNDLSLITLDNSKVFFLEYNMFNDFWSILMKSSDNVVSKIRELSDFSTDQLQYQIVFSVLAIFLYFSFSGFFYYMLLLIKKPKHELLNNFLKIPDYVITFYQNRCEMFLLLLAGEDSLDELNNSMEENEEDMNLITSNLLMQNTHKRLKGESDDDGLMIIKKKIKKAKYQKNNFSLFGILFLFIGIVFAYFYLIMYIYSTLMEKLYVNLDEYNVTSLTETYFYFTDNAQRFKLIVIFL